MAEVKKIEVRGFRSLRNVSWEPARLNVVIGPNGAGKSNLLWSLQLLQQSAEGKLTDAVLSEGGCRQLLWDHRSAKVTWRVEFIPELFKRSLTYELSLQGQPNGRGFYIDRELLWGSRKNGEAINLIERDASHAAVLDPEERKLVALPEDLDDDRTVLSERFPFGTPRVHVCRLAIRMLRVYHDLVVHRKAPVREAAVPRLVKSLSSDGQNLVSTLHTLYTDSRDFKGTVDSCMRAAFGEDFERVEFAPAADQRIQLRVRWKSLKDAVSSADLSDGTLRFLMLLTALADPDRSTLIAIDEPETSLHPRMLPVIAELAASAADYTTVVFTTHSPEFLDAFPSDSVPTTTVAECIDGETKLSKLEPEELKRWLKEYSLGKLFKSGDLEALS